nr:Atxe2 family lasso peptide isopeptidase [Sphingomonas laterariae]
MAIASPACAAFAREDPACANLVPPESVNAPIRPIAPRDLIELRDAGFPVSLTVGNVPMTVSPDGKRFAFHLRKADVAADRYCQGIFVMDIRPGARPRLLASGGELMRETMRFAGLEEIPSGTPSAVTPRWSSDGRWLLWLRRDDGVTQVWRVPADGGEARAITRSPIDVKDADWTADGAIVFSTRPGLIDFKAAVAREEPEGHLYDERYFPGADNRPHPLAPLVYGYDRIDPDSGVVRAATPAEARILIERPTYDPRPLLRVDDGQGRTAWTERDDPDSPFGPTRLSVSIRGRRHDCNDCGVKVQGLWWVDGTLLFQTAEGTDSGEIGFYRWTPGKDVPRQLFRSRDLLINCLGTARPELLCAYETPTRPRHFVLLDPGSGKIETLLDVNPEYQRVRISSVQRLHFRTKIGLEAYADLVLPPDHKPGDRHPLIVTQYLSKGFVRGSTGDEYPIQYFASRGYAVLNFQRPWGHMAPGTPLIARRAANDNLWDRRNVQEAIEAGVRTAASLGVIDTRHMGITGLSDAAASSIFALINSNLFGAVVVSGCCDEPEWAEGRMGLGFAAVQRSWTGYPVRGDANFETFWQAYALRRNTHMPSVPLLIHVSDWEMPLAIETHFALKRANWPMEMYVFDNEFHLKTGPRHLAAIYRRTVRWFDYWLLGRRHPGAEWREEYERWDKLPRPKRVTGLTNETR